MDRGSSGESRTDGGSAGVGLVGKGRRGRMSFGQGDLLLQSRVTVPHKTLVGVAQLVRASDCGYKRWLKTRGIPRVFAFPTTPVATPLTGLRRSEERRVGK